jgi:acyl-CoA dehydrogenase
MLPEQPEIMDWLMEGARKIRPEPVQSLASFKQFVDEKTETFTLPIDRAVAGGYLADRIAYAFAAGYEAALRRLAPDLPTKPIISLCITESGGGHPRAIKARLDKTPSGEGFILSGQKTFITAALQAEILMVAASTGTDRDGKNRIKMALVGSHDRGVTITPMPALPFVPEISHGVVSFAEVSVDVRDVLTGDGYDDYIKPFRTIEDIHVLGAVTGHLLRAATVFAWPKEVSERLLALVTAVRALAAGAPLSPAVHLALAGFMAIFSGFLADIEPLWEKTDAQTRARWMRDRNLLSVAEKARQARLSAAWSHYDA